MSKKSKELLDQMREQLDHVFDLIEELAVELDVMRQAAEESYLDDE